MTKSKDVRQPISTMMAGESLYLDARFLSVAVVMALQEETLPGSRFVALTE